MEVVYHAYKTTGGPGLVFKVQVPREDPVEVPSLIEIWPGVDFQEREAWDLMGIKFTGHPDLRRILMWEGYEGHPSAKIGKSLSLKRRRSRSRAAGRMASFSTPKRKIPIRTT